MSSLHAVTFVIEVLNEIGSPYLLSGSIATNAYSEPRATIDADFVLDVRGNEIDVLRDRLHGAFETEHQTSFETVTATTRHRFRHRSTKFLIEIFEARMDDPHERARFERRRPETFAGVPTFYPSPEDVIIGKLRWFVLIGRAKDREDVAGVIRMQWTDIDWPYVERWCKEHGSLDVLLGLRVEVEKNFDKI